MKRSNNSCIITICLIVSAACSSCRTETIITYGSKEEGGPTEKATISVGTAEGISDDFKNTWDENDVIGIFEPQSISSPRDFKLSSGAGEKQASFTGNLPVYENGRSPELYAIYPYDWYAGSTASATKYPISISTDQIATLGMTQYMSGMTSDGNTIILTPLTSKLEITIEGLENDEALKSIALQSNDGSSIFADSATIDLTDPEQKLTISSFTDEIRSEKVSGNTAQFILLPQDFSGTSSKDIRTVITTTKTVYNQDFKGFDAVMKKGEVTSMTMEIMDRYGDGGFIFADYETARPGEGEYADYDVIPIRGEILNSSDNTPYSFIPNASVQTGNALKLRIWFISRQETAIGKWFTLKNFGNDKYGFDPSEITEEFTGTSTISGTQKDCEWDENRHYFYNASDAEKYKVSYAEFPVDGNSRFTRLFSPEFTIDCFICNEVSEEHSGGKIPYESLSVPVTVHAVPQYFSLRAEETARPGEGEFADCSFIPIRGEYVMSKNDMTPYTFKAGTSTGDNVIGFRMWIIYKRGYVAQNEGDKYMTVNDGNGYVLGGNRDEIENLFGSGSILGIGTNGAAKSLTRDQAGYVFESEEDNEKYLISYSVYDVKKPNSTTAAPNGYILYNAGTETIHMNFTRHKDNKDSSSPEQLQCPVLVTCE